MHPILFRIPMPGWKLPLIGQLDSIPIYSYGVMLGLSLVVGWYLTLGLCKKDGLPEETMANNYVITAIVAVVAARLLYVLTNLDEFKTFGAVFSMRTGGLVAYGGFLGGFAGSLAYLRSKRIRLMPWADVAVPSLASGLAITRIGCYLFGCDFGKPLAETAPAWLKAIGTFPKWASGTISPGVGSPAWHEHDLRKLVPPDATHSLPVHPTQIYESLVGIGLLALLLWARRRQRFRGQIFFLFTFAYGAIRFMIEMLRDDPERGSLPMAMAEHVLIPLCLVVLAVAYCFSFARLAENTTVRRVTQALSFVPAVVAIVLLRPETFAGAVNISLSTSQFIGLASAVAVAVAYWVYDNAALAHPETAMELTLPSTSGDDDEDDEDEDDLEDDDEGNASDDKAPRKRSKAAKKRKSKRDDEDDEDEPVAKRKKAKKKKKKKRKPPQQSKEQDSDDAPSGGPEAGSEDLKKDPEPESDGDPEQDRDPAEPTSVDGGDGPPSDRSEDDK